MNIHLTELMAGLKELNPGFSHDEFFAYDYPGIEKGERTSISFDGKHVTNCDTNEIPEYTVYGDFGTVPIVVHPDDRNHETDITQQIVAAPGSPLFTEAYPKLGKHTRDVIYVGGHPVMAEWVIADALNGSRGPVIMLRLYYRLQQLPYTEVKLGWRKVFSTILAAKIPGITKEAIQNKFNVMLTSRVATETIDEMRLALL